MKTSNACRVLKQVSQVGRLASGQAQHRPESPDRRAPRGIRGPDIPTGGMGGQLDGSPRHHPSYRPVTFSESHRRFPVHVPMSKAPRRNPRLPRHQLGDPAPKPRRQPSLSHTLALIQVPKQSLDRPSQHRMRASASGWLRKNLTGSADAAEAVAIMPRHHLGDARQRRRIGPVIAYGTIKLRLRAPRVNLPGNPFGWMDRGTPSKGWHLAVTLPSCRSGQHGGRTSSNLAAPFHVLSSRVPLSSAWKSARVGVARGSTGFASLGSRQDGQWQRVWAGIASLPVANEDGLGVCAHRGWCFEILMR